LVNILWRRDAQSSIGKHIVATRCTIINWQTYCGDAIHRVDSIEIPENALLECIICIYLESDAGKA
jgi:hypothetical protein